MGARFARSAGCRCGLFASTSAIQTLNVSSNARGAGRPTPVTVRRSNKSPFGPVHPWARLRRIFVESRGRRASSTTNAKELRMPSQNGVSDLSDRTSWWGFVRALRAAIFSCWPEPRERRYRPERHYMRGPGPKWRAKHRHFG